MYRLTSSIVLLLFFSVNCFAQTYTLQQCIDSALANNIAVKQSALASQSAEIQLQQSRANLLPFVNADIYHGLNKGRSIDPSSNGYVNQKLGFGNYQLGAGVTVFNGGSLRNNIKQSATAFEAAGFETQQQKDNLVLNVILAYLQILNNEDILQSAINQADVSRKELERLKVLNEQGAIKPSDFSDMKGQLMNDKLVIANSKNALESSRLALAQLMNINYEPAMKLERIDPAEFLIPYTATAASVYENALKEFARVKAVQMRTKSSEYALRSLRGGFFPTVSIGGGFSSNYSSTAQNATGKIPYNNQLKNNISSSVGVGISIPVFNRFTMRNRVKQAVIYLQSSRLAEESTKLAVHQQIDQAYLDMTNAYDRYKLLSDQVNAYDESFQAALMRYNAGVGTSYDYLIAKDRLDRANLNLIIAKYDFVLRKKVLDYYNGK
jgi:outer membrane protein